jgi:hypothetical protein
MKDKYDREIDRIRAEVECAEDLQDVIGSHWGGGGYSDQYSLFQYCTPNGRITDGCGCLTQVKSKERSACTKELTKMIRKDDRIHKSWDDIKSIDELQAYAELQRYMDVNIRRQP